MSFNGSGTFNINTAGQPVVTGTTISSTAFNALTADLATGLTTCITKDGQTTATANIPLGNNKITGLANGTASTDAAAFGQLSTFGVPGYTTTATAAASTTLTVASTFQQFFTGTTTQTVVLPVVSTLVLGFQFQIVNNSTGVVTVNSSGANLVVAMVANSAVILTCVSTSGTGAASWDVKYAGMASVTGTGPFVLGTSPTIASPTLTTPALGTPASGALTNCTSIPGAQINANTVANASLAQMAANTIKGNNTGSTANAADLTVTQVKAMLSGMPIQTVAAINGAAASGTTIIPGDDTIPQNTEGDQYMALSITPTSATSTLIIEAVANIALNTPGVEIAALFQDTTANALAAAWSRVDTADQPLCICFAHKMTSGTTSATTFKVRIGANVGGTTTFNGSGGSRFFGGVMASSMRITEILP